MITCHKSHLIGRCTERGYSLDEVMECVVAQDGEEWTIDVDHPKYPRAPKPGFEPLAVTLPEPKGPGTELKALLQKIGITASPDCQCSQRARHMDEMEAKEPGWCENNLEMICDWLQEEAGKRKLPFVRMAGRILVRQAIRNARKNGQ